VQDGAVNDGLYIGLKCALPSNDSRLLESLTLVWDWDWDEIGSKPWVRLISWMILVICHVIVSFILMGVVDLTKAPYTMLKVSWWHIHKYIPQR
jgi:hypothetical protein